MTIAKQETPITAAFFERFEELHPKSEYFVMTHQDVRKSGYPDRSIHGYGHSTFWEFKHATPNFSSPGLQEITCARLAVHTYCRHVLFVETETERRIMIAHPREVFQKHGKLKRIAAEVEFDGHDFDKLAAFIHAIHKSYVLRPSF